ncbi:MAG: hypothetical protein ABI988_02380 [Nitrospirota bacterium]
MKRPGSSFYALGPRNARSKKDEKGNLVVLRSRNAHDRGWKMYRESFVRKTIDSLIATFCLLEGHALLHNDRDYDLFEDVLRLKVIRP